jgi:hypothetical protein
MQHFDIVLELARVALESKDTRVVHQVERLRDAVAHENSDQAGKLSRLLSASEERQTLTPLWGAPPG